MIPKVAHRSEGWERALIPFPRARDAFRAVLDRICAPARRVVLLPAYVGWSPREGSGIFDPVRELDLPHAFYAVTAELRIDEAHLLAQLDAHPPGLLLLVHYFGYVDPAYERVVAQARARGYVVVEDEAHALFTDVIAGRCGRLGEACLISQHKLLPVGTGGGLIVNPHGAAALAGLVGSDDGAPWRFDLAELASRRRSHARLLAELITPLAGRVDPLWSLPPDVVPQTFPVRIRTVSRDRLYEQLNGEGFGVVSLYHTMVEAITPAAFPHSHQLAREVLNLPVHQEADEPGLRALVDALDRYTRG